MRTLWDISPCDGKRQSESAIVGTSSGGVVRGLSLCALAALLIASSDARRRPLPVNHVPSALCSLRRIPQ